jgi:uncharacterized membrane protein
MPIGFCPVVLSRFKAGRLLPAALLALVAIPIAAGALRLTQLLGGANVTSENARFFAAPVPVVLHIISAALFCLLGPFQFALGVRQRWPNWHRRTGRLLIVCGVLAGLSGLWMTQFYPPVANDGRLLYVFRLLAGAGMVLCVLLGFAAIRKGRVAQHRAWTTRGYAIGVGAGTQALVHLPWILILGQPRELARALLMGAGWAINLAVAEWSVRRRLGSSPRRRSVGAPRG